MDSSNFIIPDNSGYYIIRVDANNKLSVLSPKNPIIFNESAIIPTPGPFEEIGIFRMEHQLFTAKVINQKNKVDISGIEMKRELDETSKIEPNEMTKVRKLDKQDIIKFLFELEQASYQKTRFKTFRVLK